MKERVLIKSEQYNAKRGLLIAALALTVILIVISFVMVSIDRSRTYEYSQRRYEGFLEDCNPNSTNPDEHDFWCPASRRDEKCALLQCRSLYVYSWKYSFENISWELQWIFLGYLGCLLISFLVFLWLRSYELTVTDKRIYGRVAWGKRVDLPQDSISALSTVSTLKGIAASTSSGAIKFLLIKNANEIYQIMNNQLIERQQKAQATVQSTIKQEIPTSNADELKKYKELLDQGIITQEEFDAKKKQLLGL